MAWLLASCGGGGGGAAVGGGGAGADPAGTTACAEVAGAAYPHAAEPIGGVRQIYDGVLAPDLAVNTYRNIDRLFPTRTIERGSSTAVLPRAATQLSKLSFVANGAALTLDDFLALNRVAGLLILKDGKIAHESCRYGNTQRTRWMSMSVAKSVTSTLIGAAVQDGFITSIDDQVTKYVPRLKGSAYDGVTVRQALTMTSGVRWNETYNDPASDVRGLLEARISQQPGAAMDFMSKLPRAATPGTVHNYSTGESQVLGEVAYNAIKKPLAQYLSEKIWSRVGMEAQANWWLDSPNGVEVGGSGISATLRDYGRFGLFILNDGVIDGQRVLPPGWVAEAGSPKTLSTGVKVNYGYQWWIPGGQSAVDGAFLALGLMGQQIYVNRKERVVIVVWGAQTDPTGAGTVPLSPFFDAVVAALK